MPATIAHNFFIWQAIVRGRPYSWGGLFSFIELPTYRLHFLLFIINDINEQPLKKLLPILLLALLAACSSKSSSEKTKDSTVKILNVEKSAIKDSVIKKSDSNKQVIDSGFQKLKDSIK